MKSKKFLLLRRLAWATIFAGGFGTIWFLLLMICGETLADRLTGPEPAWPNQEHLFVTTDGTPVIQCRVRGRQEMNYHDLSGTPILDRDEPTLVMPLQLPYSGKISHSMYLVASLVLGLPGWDRRLRPFVDDQHPDRIWFFVHNGKYDGAGYFVGYDQTTRERVGFIGVSGSSPHAIPASEWFPVPSLLFANGSWAWSSAQMGISSGQVETGRTSPNIPSRFVYVPSTVRVRLVDLSAGTVRTIFEPSEPIAAFGVNPSATFTGRRSNSDEAYPTPCRCVVRTTQKIYALNSEHAMLRVFQLPFAVDRESPLTWTELADGRALAAFFRGGMMVNGDFTDPCSAYQIAPDGTILAKSDLVLQRGMLPWNQQHAALTLRCALPILLVLPLVEAGMMMLIDQTDVYGVLPKMFQQSWPSYALLALLSLFLAVASLRKSRRWGLPHHEQTIWTLYVFLLGIPGYVGFQLHRRWPLLRTCPHCRTPVPLTPVTCAKCGSMLLDAVPKGIEIFV